MTPIDYFITLVKGLFVISSLFLVIEESRFMLLSSIFLTLEFNSRQSIQGSSSEAT